MLRFLGLNSSNTEAGARFRRAALAAASFPLAYFLLAGGLIFALMRTWGYDDPFITYRYAHNLAHGLGFVYNPGERVLSTTSPLWTLLLAPLAWIWPNLQAPANLIGAFSLAGGALILWDLARGWRTPWAGWLALAAYPTFPLLVMTLGSETPLYLALCLGGLWSYVRGHFTWAGLWCALAVLARPDGILMAGVLGAHYLWKWQLPESATPSPSSPTRGVSNTSRETEGWRLWVGWPAASNVAREDAERSASKQARRLRGAVLAFAGVLLPWLVFAQLYFGSPIPVTLAAKQAQGSMEISQRFFAGFFALLPQYNRWPYWGLAVLALPGLVYLLRRARPWGLLLAWTGVYFAGYSLLGVSRYTWYYAPLVPGFVILAGLGLQWLAGEDADRGASKQARRLRGEGEDADGGASKQARRLRESATPSPLWRRLAAGALLLALSAGMLRDLWSLRNFRDARLAAYRAAGEWLNANTAPGAAAGMLEVGVIGYFAQRPVVDFAGLIQPALAANMQPQWTYADAAWWAVQRFRPDYLVLPDGHFLNLEQEFIPQYCRAAARFAGAEFGFGQDLTIYACIGSFPSR